MTTKDKATKDHDAKASKEAKRIQPDSPLGETYVGEDKDFYERQRQESPDGMTAAERDQAQKSAPGALDQTAPDGEKLGVLEDEANPVQGKPQSAGR